MNREIKFRGLRTDGKGWAYGSLVNNLWVHSEFSKHEKGSPVCEIITGEYDGDCWDDILQESNCIVTVIPESVGQFIGLKDKNVTDIYEGDTIRILYTDWCSKHESDKRTLDKYLKDIASIGKVVFNYNAWEVEFYSKKYGECTSSIDCGKYGYIEIIGNIHENPELIL